MIVKILKEELVKRIKTYEIKLLFISHDCFIKISSNQIESSIKEDDLELRLLKEFNKKIDLLIEQTVSMDLDAQHCYNILKEQVKSFIYILIKINIYLLFSPILTKYQVHQVFH
jgi:hypothetical protein